MLTVRYPDRPPRSSPNGPSRSTEFAALAGISVAHLYNLRKSLGYVKARVHFTQTTAPRTPVTIGVRKRPDPQGRAGFLRVDSVHQGDHEGMKGIYYTSMSWTV